MERLVVEAKNVVKIFKNSKEEVKANDDISFSIKAGETIAVLGPNGAGKSTLIKQIIGYLSTTKGEIKLFGEDINGLDQSNMQYIGYMMQARYQHWDHLTVEEALYYSARLKKISTKRAKSQIAELTEELQLDDVLKRKIGLLSGGKKQATALACSVIGDPKLIILDEPTTGLDPEKRSLFWSFIKKINRRRNVSVVIITHNIDEIEEMVDRVFIIGKGKLLRAGKPNDLKREISDEVIVDIELDNTKKAKYHKLVVKYNGKYNDFGDSVKFFIKQKDISSCIGEIFQADAEVQFIKNIRIDKTSLEDIYIKIMNQANGEEI